VVAALVGAAIATVFAVGGRGLVTIEREAGDLIANMVPVWVAILVFPVAFALIAVRLVWRASPHWIGRAIAAVGIALGLFLAERQELLEGARLWPWLVGLAIAGVLGTPIFALLGGIAMLGFFTD